MEREQNNAKETLRVAESDGKRKCEKSLTCNEEEMWERG
jgi:hypothetical protein